MSLTLDLLATATPITPTFVQLPPPTPHQKKKARITYQNFEKWYYYKNIEKDIKIIFKSPENLSYFEQEIKCIITFDFALLNVSLGSSEFLCGLCL